MYLLRVPGIGELMGEDRIFPGTRDPTQKGSTNRMVVLSQSQTRLVVAGSNEAWMIRVELG